MVLRPANEYLQHSVLDPLRQHDMVAAHVRHRLLQLAVDAAVTVLRYGPGSTADRSGTGPRRGPGNSGPRQPHRWSAGMRSGSVAGSALNRWWIIGELCSGSPKYPTTRAIIQFGRGSYDSTIDYKMEQSGWEVPGHAIPTPQYRPPPRVQRTEVPSTLDSHECEEACRCRTGCASTVFPRPPSVGHGLCVRLTKPHLLLLLVLEAGIAE